MTGDSSRTTGSLRGSPRAWLTAAALVAAAVTVTSGISTLTATAADAATPHQIGAAPMVPQGAVRTGTPAGSTRLRLDVELAPRDPAGLAAFVQAVSDPKSPEYKHYLAKGQFAAVFGASPATINSVTGALRSAGLTPGTPTQDGLTIPVTTTFAKAGAAFGTTFANYRLKDGRVAFANDTAPSLPSSVAGEVSGIVGLNSLVVPNAEHTAPPALPKNKSGAVVNRNSVRPNSASPSVCSNVVSYDERNFNWFDTANYWEPGTLSSAQAYNTGQLYTKYGDTGQNVTVGLFELENYSSSDIGQYQSCFGTNVPLTNITIDGGPTAAPDPNQNIGIESALDIDTIAGLAPGVSIRVYQGPDAVNASDANVLDVYQQMETDDAAQVISTSWGECALGMHNVDAPMATAENNVFAAMAAQGQSVLAASGDHGSTACFNEGFPGNLDGQLSVDDPAEQGFVTAVGGTSLIGQGTNPATQSTWNTPRFTDPTTGQVFPGAASGGGVSQFTTLSGSGNYQQGFTGPGFSNVCSAASGSVCRQVPDVSALADPAEGYLTSCGPSPLNDGTEFFCPIGGTSGAAPLWAAITALADSGLSCAGNGNAGFLNPALYAHAGHERDVTTGSNFLPDSGYTGGLYSAGTGYDLTTGLGSPNAAQVVEDVCGARGAAPGSDYVPVTPVRIMDTGAGGIGPNGTHALQISNANGVPASGVTAVVLNVTAVNSSTGGYLTVYPDGTARPTSSNLNFSPGQTIPNLVTVQVGTDGAIDFYNHAGNVQVLADLQGYYTTNTNGGSTYQPVTPTRLLDATPVGQNGHQLLQILGQGGVPSTGVSGVILNVTATAPTDFSYLSVYPDGATQPVVSNLNVTPGETIPNLVIVPVGNDGKVNIYNHVGTTDVLADVEGYYTSSQTGLKFHPSAPHRVLDTRIGEGVAAGQPAVVGANTTLGLPVDDTVNGLGNKGPIASSGGVVLNVIATDTTDSSYLKVFPSAAGSPTVSNLNFTAGETIPNAVMTPVNGPFIDFYNHVGNVDVVADLFGYFASS
jgi:subtilase family serine protease